MGLSLLRFKAYFILHVGKISHITCQNYIQVCFRHNEWNLCRLSMWTRV